MRSGKYVPLRLGSIPHCAQVPEGLAVGDQPSALRCWAGAMSGAASPPLPDKQQGCSGASQPPFPPVAGAHVCCGASGCLDGTGEFSSTEEAPLCWVIAAQPGTRTRS